jgi:hypothetical protein
MTLHQLTGTPDDWRVRARAAMGGARRRLSVDLPAEAESHRGSCARSWPKCELPRRQNRPAGERGLHRSRLAASLGP